MSSMKTQVIVYQGFFLIHFTFRFHDTFEVCDNGINTKDIVKVNAQTQFSSKTSDKGFQNLPRPLRYMVDLTRKIKMPIVYESEAKINTKEIPISLFRIRENSKSQNRSGGRSNSTARRDQMVDLSEAMEPSGISSMPDSVQVIKTFKIPVESNYLKTVIIKRSPSLQKITLPVDKIYKIEG